MSQKLIKCKSCEKEISPEAKTCPHCGAPNKKRRKFGSVIVVLFLIGLVIEISGIFDKGPSNPSPSPTPTPQAPADTPAAAAQPSSTPAPSAYPLNQPVTAGHMEWVIESAEKSDTFNNADTKVSADSDEATLVYVVGKVTNRSNAEDNTIAGNVFLIDDKGAKYGEKDGSEIITKPLTLSGFNPNVPREFSVIFEVPKTATGLKFQATDFGVLSPATALIDLGLDKQ